MGSIDLSVGAIVLLVGAVVVTAINGLDLGLSALAIGTLLGTLLGLANGMVFAIGLIPSFVVTLGSLSVFSGIALNLLAGRALQYNSPAIRRTRNRAVGAPFSQCCAPRDNTLGR